MRQGRQESRTRDRVAEDALHDSRGERDQRRELHAQEVEMVTHREVEQFVAMEAEARLGQRVNAECEEQHGKEQRPGERWPRDTRG